jgi:hypothetical protein
MYEYCMSDALLHKGINDDFFLNIHSLSGKRYISNGHCIYLKVLSLIVSDFISKPKRGLLPLPL